MPKAKLFLIDATAFCYRAFYALEGLSTSFGQPTNAIYGFMNMLNKILKEKKPDYMAVCFDVSRDTFRQKKFAEYKIQRPPMPEGLASQIPLIKQIIAAYGIAIFEKEGYEADDIIATIARLSKQKDQKDLVAIIVSSDKDILQLVDEDTFVFSPYEEEGTLYDSRKVSERFSVSPKQIADIIALTGDSVDNIPAISGITKKVAIDLITSFNSVENLLSNINKIKQDKLRDTVAENMDKIKLNKELASLRGDVDINFDLDKAGIRKPNFKELFRLFYYLEFKKFLKDLPYEEDNKRAILVENLLDAKLPCFFGAQEEFFLSGEHPHDLVFYAKNKFFQVTDFGMHTASLLQDPKIRKTGHDLKKIRLSLAKDNIVLGGLYFDTMVASYLVNPSRAEYKLVDLAWDYLGERLKEQDSIDSKRAIALILELKPRLEKELSEKQLSSLFRDLEMPLIEVLATMELNGIKLDLGVLGELSHHIEHRLIKLIEDIYSLSGTQFNINSPKQLREILFEKLKLPIVKRSKTGPSTDEEVLRNLAAQHKLPALLLEYRQLMKLKTTYLEALAALVDKKTGRIHTSFNQTATETGRLSSSNPNLQNLPIKTDIGKNIRRSIIPSRPGDYLLACDYSQIELRILAHLSKDENLALAFKEDKDIHRLTASLIYGLEEKDISDSMREVAKRVNFGIIYGLSSYGLSRDLGISVDEAQRFIDAYFLRYPKVKDYIQEQIRKAEVDGFVTTLLGRRRYIPEINNKNQGIRQFAQRQAVNTPIQGSASDLIKLAMIQIHNQLKLKSLKSKLILQIHDELLFDVPEVELKELACLTKDRMENVLKLSVPIKVDIKFGKNWLEMEPVLSAGREVR